MLTEHTDDGAILHIRTLLLSSRVFEQFIGDLRSNLVQLCEQPHSLDREIDDLWEYSAQGERQS